jgi:hypothetical protein
MDTEFVQRLDAFKQFFDLPRRMFGRRSPQPTLLREPCLARRHERLPPAFEQLAIDIRINAFGQRRFVLPGGTHDSRAKRSLVHDDQLMVVQPAARKQQQSLPITGSRQFLPQCAHQRATLWLAEPMKSDRFTDQLLMLNQRRCTPIHGA